MRAYTIADRTQEILTFAVRIRVKMPLDVSPGMKMDIVTWLITRFGRRGFAYRRIDAGPGCPEVFYFRQLQDAQEFLAAFPALHLDTEATSGTETSPEVPGGVERERRRMTKADGQSPSADPSRSKQRRTGQEKWSAS